MKVSTATILTVVAVFVCSSSSFAAQDNEKPQSVNAAELERAVNWFGRIRDEYSIKGRSELRKILTTDDIISMSRILSSTQHIQLWSVCVQYIGKSEPSDLALSTLQVFLAEPVEYDEIPNYLHSTILTSKGCAIRYLGLMNDPQTDNELRKSLNYEYAREFASPWIDELPDKHAARRSFVERYVISHVAIAIVNSGDKEGIDEILRLLDEYERVLEQNKQRYIDVSNISEEDYVLRDKYKALAPAHMHLKHIELYGLNKAVDLEFAASPLPQEVIEKLSWFNRNKVYF